MVLGRQRLASLRKEIFCYLSKTKPRHPSDNLALVLRDQRQSFGGGHASLLCRLSAACRNLTSRLEKQDHRLGLLTTPLRDMPAQDSPKAGTRCRAFTTALLKLPISTKARAIRLFSCTALP